MKRILSNTIIVLMATLAMFSCKESTTVDPTVTLTEQTITLTQKDTYQLTAELSDYSHDYIVWASNNSEVATVNQEGLVTAVAPGTAEITAKCEYGKDRKTCTVTVNPIYVTAIKLDKTSVSKKEGETETLTATITPSDATYQTVTWSTSDAEVATVKDGVVSCIGAGTATITVATANGATSGAALTATCTVNVKSSGNFIKWVNDAAGSKNFITEPASASGTSTQGWITYDGTKISWTANETGAPRVDSLILNTGSKIIISQVEDKDFKGSWTFTSKRFSNATDVKPAGNPAGTDELTIGDPLLGETLNDFDGKTHINQFGITGLYQSAVADASIEIDYNARTAKLGIFLDARDNAQKVAIPFSGLEYVCFLPEMSKGIWSATWNFIQVDLDSEKDYCWLWFDCQEDFSFCYNPKVAPQKMTGNKANTSANTIIGITVAASSDIHVNAETVKGANRLDGNSGNYPVIYQSNPNNDGAQYTIVRKVN